MSGSPFNTPGFGQPGGIGFLSPFDLNSVANAGGQSVASMTNRYKQLGLGNVGATPTGPTTGATPGVPGSGATPTSPGSFFSPNTSPTALTTAINNAETGGTLSPTDRATLSGAGPTAFQMDVGIAPSLTGGLPAEAGATAGEIQTQDLGLTSASAQAAIQGKSQQTSGGFDLLKNIFNLI